MFWVVENMERVLVKTMEKWKTELTSGGQKLETVRKRRGIFQGNSVSTLLFVLALIPLLLLLTKLRHAISWKMYGKS